MAMFENISEFFKRFMQNDKKELLAENPPSQSKDTAKDRLHVVLMQDRANVSADFLEMMKEEIIEVIKKYIVVDESKIDVRLTNEENDDGSIGAPLLHANIPIVNVRNDLKGTHNSDYVSEKIDGQQEMNLDNAVEEKVLDSEENKIDNEVDIPKLDSVEENNKVIPESVIENLDVKEVDTSDHIADKNDDEIDEDELDDDDDVTFDDLLKAAEEEEREEKKKKTRVVSTKKRKTTTKKKTTSNRKKTPKE